MGKKRIITKEEDSRNSDNAGDSGVSRPKSSRKKQILKGIINVSSSYNNTIVSIADTRGEVFTWSSSGALGFKGTRKSTPYAATLVAQNAAEKARYFGLTEATVIVKGIGPGREAAIRGIVSAGINVNEIIDTTPMPHNGVRAKKPRRV